MTACCLFLLLDLLPSPPLVNGRLAEIMVNSGHMLSKQNKSSKSKLPNIWFQVISRSNIFLDAVLF